MARFLFDRSLLAHSASTIDHRRGALWPSPLRRDVDRRFMNTLMQRGQHDIDGRGQTLLCRYVHWAASITGAVLPRRSTTLAGLVQLRCDTFTAFAVTWSRAKGAHQPHTISAYDDYCTSSVLRRRDATWRCLSANLPGTVRYT